MMESRKCICGEKVYDAVLNGNIVICEIRHYPNPGIPPPTNHYEPHTCEPKK